jgi:hypothetical protein
LQVTEGEKVDIKICDYYERPETPEEAEERKKREEALLKGKKKPAVDKKKVAEVRSTEVGAAVHGEGAGDGFRVDSGGAAGLLCVDRVDPAGDPGPEHPGLLRRLG